MLLVGVIQYGHKCLSLAEATIKGIVSVYSRPDVTKKRNRDVFCVFSRARKMETSVYSLRISQKMS